MFADARNAVQLFGFSVERISVDNYAVRFSLPGVKLHFVLIYFYLCLLVSDTSLKFRAALGELISAILSYVYKCSLQKSMQWLTGPKLHNTD